jgi:hypothetical protein
MLFNRDTFTGKDLVRKSDTGWGNCGHAWLVPLSTVCPQRPIAPGSYNFNTLMDGAAYTLDTELGPYTGRTKGGDPIPLTTAVLDVAGSTKIRTADPERAVSFKRYDIQKEEREVKANISSARRNKAMTDGSRERYIEDQNRKLETLRRRMGEINQ